MPAVAASAGAAVFSPGTNLQISSVWHPELGERRLGPSHTRIRFQRDLAQKVEDNRALALAEEVPEAYR